jgi:hypothetical protein
MSILRPLRLQAVAVRNILARKRRRTTTRPMTQTKRKRRRRKKALLLLPGAFVEARPCSMGQLQMPRLEMQEMPLRRPLSRPRRKPKVLSSKLRRGRTPSLSFNPTPTWEEEIKAEALVPSSTWHVPLIHPLHSLSYWFLAVTS